jgi:hypothetical protein
MPAPVESNRPERDPNRINEVHVRTESPEAAAELVKSFWLSFAPGMIDEDTEQADLLREMTHRGFNGARTQVINESTVLFQANRGNGQNSFFTSKELEWIRSVGGENATFY